MGQAGRCSKGDRGIRRMGTCAATTRPEGVLRDTGVAARVPTRRGFGAWGHASLQQVVQSQYEKQ